MRFIDLTRAGVLAATVALLGCNAQFSQTTMPVSANDVGVHYSVKINPAEFDAQVRGSSRVVMVDFWAPWCQPCLALGPTIEELAHEYEGLAVIGKYNTDENKNAFREFGLAGIPALVFFKDGKEVDRIVGVKPKAFIAEKLDRLLRE